MECTKVNCPMQAGTPTDNCGEHNFQEVMRQWQRMCKSMQEKNMSCKGNCLLGNNPTCGELEYASLEEINNAETMIMKWAAEHQEFYFASVPVNTRKRKKDEVCE